MSPTTTDKPTLPRNLSAALRRADLTQWQLSQAAGIHPSEVQRIVSRGMKPTPEQAAKIAAALKAAA